MWRLANPWFLLILVFPLALLFYHYWSHRRGRSSILYSGGHLLANLPISWRASLAPHLHWLRYLGLVLLTVAMSRPQTGNSLSEIETFGVDIMLVLDVSGTMEEKDMVFENRGITRLEAAKYVMAGFVEGRTSDRIGLIAFASQSLTRCPLTVDYDLVSLALDEIDHQLFPKNMRFTAVGNALGTAVGRLWKSDARSKVVIMLTDGANNTGNVTPLAAAELAKTEGIRVYTIGFGSPGKTDVDEENLKQIAETTGGRFFRSKSLAQLQEVYDLIDKLEKSEVVVKNYEVWNEWFQWFLWAGCVLLLLEVVMSQIILQKGALIVMRFANPEILYFLALIPLLVVIFILAERKRRRQLVSLIDMEKPAMVMGAGFERRLIYLLLLNLGVGLLVTAAARPQWGTQMETMRSRGFDILVAVDVSESMRATDVAPDRISKARQEVDKFLNLLEGDRVGLIAFAGSAYAFCPLTNDYAAIRLFLSGLEPGVIEDSGTDVGSAVEEAVKTFERSKSTAHRVLVVFSDGEHHEDDPLPSVVTAVKNDIQVFTVGVGNVTKSGERIPQVDERTDEVTYKLDQTGNLIITRLDEATLQSIAQEGNGAYYRVSEAGTELSQIYKSLSKNEETEFSSRQHRRMEDRYQWPLAGAFLFLVIAYSLGNRSFKKLRRTQGVKS